MSEYITHSINVQTTEMFAWAKSTPFINKYVSYNLEMINLYLSLWFDLYVNLSALLMALSKNLKYFAKLQWALKIIDF